MFLCSAHRDAAWETEPNAFAELLEVPDTCEATVCVCPQGRGYENTQYTLIRCDTCGSHCVHNKCLPPTKKLFTCGACVLPSVSDVASPEEPTSSLQEEEEEEETNNESTLAENVEESAQQTTSDSLESNENDSSDDSDSDDYMLSAHNFLVVKWNNILTPSHKRKSNDSTNNSKNNNNSIYEGVPVGKNLSATSDVEFVETKEEVMCISDDEEENLGSANHIAAVAQVRKKRAPFDTEMSPPIQPPNKKVRRALETMRSQSKITSFFTQLGKGVSSSSSAGWN